MSRSEPNRLPVPVAPAEPAAPAPVEAQVLGQGGAKRGLREGPTALKRARTAYLSTEWSGEDDRRPGAGLLVRDKL